MAQTQSAPDSSSSGGATPRTGLFLEVGRVDVGMMTFLSTITLGISFLVWLYKAMRVYRTLSGRSGVNLEQYFWATVIAFGSAVILLRLPSAGLLVTLLVVGNAASLTVCGLIIGIPVAIWFYYRFFTGHNLITGSLETGREGDRR